MAVIRDHADVVHFAGWQRLSPALQAGRPALVALSDQEGRCGWEPFFRAMERHALALQADRESGTFRFVSAAERTHRRRAPAAALTEARRFLAALRA